MFREKFEIDGVTIGEKPYIIAELSANHNNDIEIAKQSIEAAKKAGANAIKFQTYTPDTLTLPCKKKHFEAKGAWKGEYLYDLYKKGYMPWEWFGELQAFAKEKGITLFSTPFDFSSVDFLEKYDVPAYKIASPEIIDLPFIKYVAKTGKPIVLSTGSATLSQIAEAVDTIAGEGNDRLAILKCTSEYPAPPEKINLKTIANMKEIFKVPIGLSDHTLGTAIPVASIAAGTSIVEKHFILDKNINTIDSFFSSDFEELKEIVEGANLVYQALGEVDYPSNSVPQRSLIAVKTIQKGEKLIFNDNFKSLRPGGGIEPKFSEIIHGSTAKRKIDYGELLIWEMIL